MAPTQRHRHLQCITETGRRGWQQTSGYNSRVKVEAATGQWEQVIGGEQRARWDHHLDVIAVRSDHLTTGRAIIRALRRHLPNRLVSLIEWRPNLGRIVDYRSAART